MTNQACKCTLIYMHVLEVSSLCTKLLPVTASFSIVSAGGSAADFLDGGHTLILDKISVLRGQEVSLIVKYMK